MAVLSTQIVQIFKNAINLRDIRSILDKLLIKKSAL